MKTEIWASFNFGAWQLDFKKEYDLPFTPFFDMVISDEVNGIENDIRLETHDYCTTTICYDITESKFIIDIREHWKRPVRDDVVDDTIKIFMEKSLPREDNTNIDDFKELMNRQHKMSKL